MARLHALKSVVNWNSRVLNEVVSHAPPEQIIVWWIQFELKRMRFDCVLQLLRLFLFCSVTYCALHIGICKLFSFHEMNWSILSLVCLMWGSGTLVVLHTYTVACTRRVYPLSPDYTSIRLHIKYFFKNEIFDHIMSSSNIHDPLNFE